MSGAHLPHLKYHVQMFRGRGGKKYVIVPMPVRYTRTERCLNSQVKQYKSNSVIMALI